MTVLILKAIRTLVVWNYSRMFVTLYTHCSLYKKVVSWTSCWKG